MSQVVLSAKGVVKRFGGVQALRGVDFELNVGEIHALLGENGAGKSTLMNLLSGVHTPDEGEIFIDGKPARFHSPRDAQAAGIATIFQELDLVPSLSVAANLFLGHELVRPHDRLMLADRGSGAAWEHLRLCILEWLNDHWVSGCSTAASIDG